LFVYFRNNLADFFHKFHRVFRDVFGSVGTE